MSGMNKTLHKEVRKETGGIVVSDVTVYFVWEWNWVDNASKRQAVEIKLFGVQGYNSSN